MTDMERLTKLYKIAEQDSVFQAWKHAFDDNQNAFHKYADKRSKRTRNILYSYADGGRMMLQRLSYLACTHMEFPEEKDKGAP